MLINAHKISNSLFLYDNNLANAGLFLRKQSNRCSLYKLYGTEKYWSRCLPDRWQCASITITVVMCGGIVAGGSRIQNSKLAFLLLLLSIAHLPLLRHVDAKILRGNLVTREVNAYINNRLIYKRRTARLYSANKFDLSPGEAGLTWSILSRAENDSTLQLKEDWINFH